AEKHGEEQTGIWRRSYDVRPPALAPDDPRHPRFDPRYAKLRPEELPATECLKDTVERFLPYWHETIAPRIRAGERVLIAAHGNSLRALVKYLDGISDDAIVGLNIPTGIPLVYELEDDLRPIRSFYLGDPAAVRKATDAVAGQLKRKAGRPGRRLWRVADQTKSTATIGPGSASRAVMEAMIRAGMDVARLNFSHGGFDDHRRNIDNLRAAAMAAGRDVAILADLPGPKIRLGAIAGEPI